MHSLPSVLCIAVCLSLCSNGKLHVEKSGSKDVETAEKPTQNFDEHPSVDRRKFRTKEDIPKEYLDHLIERYGISEDPQGDYEKKQKEFMTKHGKSDEDDYDSYENREYTGVGDSLYYDDVTVEAETESKNDTEDGNSTCKACELLEEARAFRIETIKYSILGQLGFESDNLPNMTGKVIPKIPSIEKLLEQEMQNDQPVQPEGNFIPEDQIYGQVKKAYTIAQPPPKAFGIDVPGGCYFELPESVTSRKIQDATLWVYLKTENEKRKRKEFFYIRIVVIDPKAKQGNMLKGEMHERKKKVDGWIEFKFARFAQKWAGRPKTNRGVVIQAFDDEGNNMVVTPEMSAEERFFPMLEMTTVEHTDRHTLRKRHVNNICTERDKRTTCCRYPLRVDFVSFGWDWVIAPTGYTANYCAGECRHRHVDDNPNAYLVQQVPLGTTPCCTAAKWFPLAMLYFDHAHTVLYTYMQKMIIDRCSCA